MGLEVGGNVPDVRKSNPRPKDGDEVQTAKLDDGQEYLFQNRLSYRANYCRKKIGDGPKSIISVEEIKEQAKILGVDADFDLDDDKSLMAVYFRNAEGGFQKPLSEFQEALAWVDKPVLAKYSN